MDVTIDTDKVLEMAARRVADEVINESNAFEQASDLIASRIDKLFSERLEARVIEHVDAAIGEGFRQEFRKVDQFGRPQGEPTTIEKQLNVLVSEYWQQTVDRSGKATSAASYGKNTTRAEWTMIQICGDEFQKELRQNVVNTTAHLKDGLRVELRGWVDKTLGELFRVQSADDKAEGRR